MKSKSILFVGCGDIGVRLGGRLHASGWSVTGLRRDVSRLPTSFKAIAADYSRAGELKSIAPPAPDYLVATCNPTERSVAGYEQGFTEGARNILEALGSHRPKALFWVSSTRVYAERDGGWVNEDSPLSKDDPRADAMIRAEQLMLNSSHNVSVIRFAGIYGGVGGRLLDRIRRGELNPELPVRYSNRIHREDCAGFLLHLIERVESGQSIAPIYNGVDAEPSPQGEVDRWLAAQIGLPAEAANVNADSGQRTGAGAPVGHKRCSNRLLTESGYELTYPDYRVGYAAALAAKAPE
ncbi:MAG: NAD(P)H-binding protein [Pseudomonadota bacterium]